MTGFMCIIGFIMGFFAYRIAFGDGHIVSAGGRIKTIMKKQQKLTEEEVRLNRGMENILNYSNRRKRGIEDEK